MDPERLTSREDRGKQQPMSAPASKSSEARESVLVAMSGGVDSSLAAALLHRQGYRVVGVTLHLWDAEGEDRVGRCCAPEDREDARRTCDFLGIPHYVMDERAAFRARVVDPFLDQNLAGKTPSPCVACNQQVKLSRLAELATQLDIARIATGHYARVERGSGAGPTLWMGKDRGKDQSYFLFGVAESLLARLEFPLGSLTKHEVRGLAREMGLPNWDKPDSQELCFVPDGDIHGFAARHRAEAGRSGPILDEVGRVLGTHRGLEGYTVGQRRGVGVAGAHARYVLKLIPEKNAIVLGPEERLGATELAAENAVWIGEEPRAEFDAEVRIRYRHAPSPARVVPDAAGFHVRFETPQRAAAPGQAAVVYRGTQVLGGGFIAASI